MDLQEYFARAKRPPLPLNSLQLGNCIGAMGRLPAQSVDFILTDPPYLARYKDRAGRTVRNDDQDDWLKPAYTGMYRARKPNAFAVSFYGWPKVDRFFEAWKEAGFTIGGHIVFRKRYTGTPQERQFMYSGGSPGLRWH